jgi:hypothetical protein
MDQDDTAPRRPRRMIVAALAALALAVAIPVGGALASGSGGGGGDSTAPSSQPVQDGQDRPAPPDRDCPKEDRGGQRGSDSQTALPV